MDYYNEYEIEQKQNEIQECKDNIFILKAILREVLLKQVNGENIVNNNLYNEIFENIKGLIDDYSKSSINFYKKNRAIAEKVDKHIIKKKYFDMHLNLDFSKIFDKVSANTLIDSNRLRDLVSTYDLNSSLEKLNGKTILSILNIISSQCNQIEYTKKEIEALKHPKREKKEEEVIEMPRFNVDEIAVSLEETKVNETTNYQNQSDSIEDKRVSALKAGPKKKGLFSREDPNLNNIATLYGMFGDLFILFTEQYPKCSIKRSADRNLINTESFFNKQEMDNIYAQYGVNNFGELYNLYGNLREQYYKVYSKLSDDNKKAYNVESMIGLKSFALEEADVILKKHKFKFPPDKEELKTLFNERIINHTEKYPIPNHLYNGNDKVREYEDILRDSENKLYDEYSKLAQNMTIEETIEFYKSVKRDLNESSKYSYTEEEKKCDVIISQVITYIFSKVIFYKKGLEHLDGKQMQEELNKIMVNDLKIVKQEANFELSQEELVHRKKTVIEEYIVYYAKLKDKNTKLSLQEFVKQKYGKDQIIITDELENKVEEEISIRRL